MQENNIPFEIEQLETVTQYNEYIMISLRMQAGFSIAAIETRFGEAYVAHTKSVAAALIVENKLVATPTGFAIPKKARFLADGIASDFFIVD